MSIKLSICIPTYNRARFLPDLLDSIVRQIDDNNKDIIEVVISDNASMDNTTEVVNSYRDKIVNLVYFRWDENKGADRNFLKVVELAHGEYCWLMGSDDVIEDGGINYVLDFLNINNCTVGCSVNFNAYDFALKYKIRTKPICEIKKDFVLDNIYFIFKNLFGYFGYLSGQIVNRDLWNEVVNENRNILHNYFNAYVHVYIISKMILKKPLWGYIDKKIVGWRSGNDSFLDELGVLKRMYIDIMGYEKISKDIFGVNSELYRILNGQILRIHVRSHILNIKMNSRLNYKKTIEILRITFKYYKRYLYFYYFIVPFILTPLFVIKFVRLCYRVSIKNLLVNNRYFFKNKVLIILMGLIDSIGMKMFKVTNHDYFKKDVSKILVSNIGHLGDVLISLPLIEYIKKSNKNVQIFYLCLKDDVVLLKNNPNISKIIPYYSFFQSSEKDIFRRTINSLFSFINTIFIIRKLNPNVAFDLRASFANTLFLLWLSGVKRIIGYGTVGFRFVLSKEIEWDEQKHEIEHYKDILKVMFNFDYFNNELNLNYLCNNVDIENLFLKFGINKDKKKIIFHITSRDKRKMIDIEKWKEIYNYCKDKYEVILTGDKSDVDYIKKHFGKYENLKNLSGKLNLGELIILLKNVHFIIAIDSFIGQLCSILNLSSILIFSGPVDLRRFGPIGNRCVVLKKDIFCSPCGWYLREGCKYECKDLNILEKFIELENKI